VLNEVIVPHGNRQGMSVGWLTTSWLGYILSEADHRRKRGSAVGGGSAPDLVGRATRGHTQYLIAILFSTEANWLNESASFFIKSRDFG
jgi:hypothetical protein